ncbi:MAG: Tetratricopeptide repeat protein [Bacteroidetes bacterium ADurb.Bin408]|nr:MAG: Tetratricopeptide repeat protein [Bacteroidetes bacterium ADurb.Bin408]
MKNIFLVLFLALLLCPSLMAQSELKMLRKGNSDFKNGKFNEAEIKYRKALEKNNRNYKTLYNLGSALYKQNNYKEAVNVLNDLSEQQLDDKIRSKIYYNLGNALLKDEKYAESIDAYKKSLRLNSKDMDTKYNLSYALSKIQQQQQNNSCDNKQDNKEQKDKQENKQNDKNNDPKDNKDNQQQQQKEQQKEQQNKNEISKEDAERILNALEKQEKDVKDKVDKQLVPVKIKNEKDW